MSVADLLRHPQSDDVPPRRLVRAARLAEALDDTSLKRPATHGELLLSGTDLAPIRIVRSAETRDNSMRLQPLRELPALTLDREEADVRGWAVTGRDGGPVGHVTDLLADPDALQADYVIVTIDAEDRRAGQAETVVPVAALRAVPEQQQLISDGGMRPIRLRYQSTTRLVWWAAALLIVVAAVLLALDVW